jgi:hypothetical protein
MVCDEDENIIVLLNINTLAHQDIMTDLIWLNKLGKYGCIKSDGKTSRWLLTMILLILITLMV